MSNQATLADSRPLRAAPGSGRITMTFAAALLGLLPATAAGWIAPATGLTEVTHDQVSLQGGFWGPRQQIHHKTTISHAFDALERNGHITNFDKAAGKFDGELRGHHAFDSDLHKAMEGAMYSLQHFDDPALHKRAESILDRILASQQDDGFMISYYIVKDSEKRWDGMRTEHQMYNAGHFFELAVEHQRLTGDTRALAAAKRFADHIDGIFGPGKRYDVGGHEEIELALIKLYRATGEQRYLDLCRFLLDERGHAHGPERKPFTPGPLVVPEREKGQSDREYSRAKRMARLYWRNGRMQDHKPLVEQTEAVGHAVRAGYIYSAMADMARFSEAPAYATAVEKLWQDVLSRKLYVNGGIGTAQYGDEGFGDPYLLPNKTYCESCSSIAHVFWQHRMNLLKGEAKYADVMELVLYNAALSGMSLTGDSFFYQNPLQSKNGGERRDWIGLACCPTNLTRFTPQVGGFVYAHAKNRLHVNLFAAGEATVRLDGNRVVKLTQDTNYPWDGKIKLTVAPEKPSDFDLCIRIPGWALGKPVPSDLYRFASPETAPVTLNVNGKPVETTREDDGYVHLNRSWKTGDVVELDLPMPVRRVHAHEKVAANTGKVALMRGPVVYCLEGVDNESLDLFKLALSGSSKLSTAHRPDLLGGVTVINGQALDDDNKPVEFTAVPYYAWANREKGPMTIWIDETADAGPVSAADNRWPPAKAWKWFRDQPWPCGFNYVPANAISYTEMWMPSAFDAKLIDKELALAQETGFNCLRVVLPFIVWEHDPAAFRKRLSTFLSVCDKRGIKVMLCLFDDCAFGSEEKLKDPWYGKQPEVLEGWYANGWTPSPGHSLVRDPKQWPRLKKYVSDLIGSFKNDERVWVWDLYNEPTNGGLGNVSVPLVEKVFGWARQIDPTQPLTIAQWNGNATLNDVIYRRSDIITFHSYRKAEDLSKHIASLKKHGRPMINTEWLNRGHKSLVATCLPIFSRANVGCMHWGLVNGKTQTDLNWGHRPGQPDPPVWQHDLFHGDHKPYDAEELDLFQRTIRQHHKSGR